MASEYGWTEQYIKRKVYPEQIPVYSNCILKRKIHDYKMQLLIAQNPHIKDPKSLFDEMDRLEREISGADYLESKLDKEGFKRLKDRIKSQSKFVVAK